MTKERWEIARLALASRTFLLLAMSLSHSIIPDLYPGDDVLQFDLRLSSTTPSWSSSSQNELEQRHTCFCLQGHGCDIYWKSRRRRLNNGSSSSPPCADNNTIASPNANDHRRSNTANSDNRHVWLDRFYAFILPPVTKWDAARFLILSVDPWARYPPDWPLEERAGKNVDQTHLIESESTTSTCSDSDDAVCESIPERHADTEYDNEKRFHSSEQAHAFLPLLPLVIRYTAIGLMKIVPSDILPPTFEATAVLSAILINMVTFLIASLSLYDLTILLLKRDDALESNKSKKYDSNVALYDNETQQQRLTLAKTTAQLFCINPAGVFFTTAYSESIFAMLTFAGHAIFVRGQCRPYRWTTTSLCWIVSAVLWMLASYTRSNGTFSSIWLILIGISKCCFLILNCSRQSIHRKSYAHITVQCLSVLMLHGVFALLVAYPVYYHDWRGYNFHCLQSTPSTTLQSPTLPSWCKSNVTGVGFSLYAHVQRKHWNVGLFRYYELKQIPNFILALPVLGLSFAGAALWIRDSWHRHGNQEGQRSVTSFVKSFILWSFVAMGNSTNGFYAFQNHAKTIDKSAVGPATMLRGQMLLSYYAVLAGFAVVGTFLAHVQISTRLICSSCPALYWFVSSLLTPFLTTQRNEDSGVVCSIFRINLDRIIYFYFALYNILGIVMHVNWLPWT